MKLPGQLFTEAEMNQLLRDLQESARRGRTADRVDHALVRFAWATGCRVSELASISLDRRDENWLDVDNGVAVIREAKWNSVGTVPLDVTSLRVVRRYIRHVRPLLRNADTFTSLFLTRTGVPYNSNKLTKKLSLLLARYGFPGRTAHSLRHRFCTDLLSRGVGLHEVKALMRHRDVRATMVYSHATVEDLRAAVNRRAH